MKRFYTRLISTAIILSITASVSRAQDEAPILKLQTGNYNLTAETSAQSLKSSIETWPEFVGQRFGIISLENYPTTEEWENLAESGVHKLEYLPKRSFSVSISQNADLTMLSEFGDLWSLSYSNEFKSELNVSAPPSRARVEDLIIINVHPFSSISPKSVWSNLSDLNAELIEIEEGLGYLTIAIDPMNFSEIIVLPFVKWIDWIYDAGAPENYTGRTSHRVNYISGDNNNGIDYDGSGINVALQDDGSIGPHIDHEGRIVEQFWQASLGDHGDHVGGTINGAGNLNPYHEGQAKGSDLYVYKAAPEYQAYDSMSLHYYSKGIVITSTSYSNGCNAGYTALARQMDQQVYDYESLVHVFSAGNSGTSNCGYGAGNTWGNITGGHKIGKNVITVANLTETDLVATSSSRGPSEDGRIKPDISAKGTSVTSTLDGNNYGVKTGTSMSCPGVSGTLAVLYEAFEDQQGNLPPSGLMKAIVLNTAEDLGNTGPDYIYGWGRINARKAYDVIENSSFTSGSLSDGDSTEFTLIVPPGMSSARFMLYWTDPEAAVNASTVLINDLDLTITDPNSNETLPYLLNPAPNATTLNAPASPGVDDLNNAEQVEFFTPTSGNYLVKVKGTNVPDGPQEFYVVYWFEAEELTLTYPIGGESLVPFTSEKIRWDSPYTSGTVKIEYSGNGGSSWNTIVNSVSASQGFHNWTVPNLATGNVQLRLTYGSEIIESDEFSVIRTPTNLVVEYSCPDSIGLSWNSVFNASEYDVYSLGTKYMEEIGTTTETEFVDYLSNPMSDKVWYSVSSLGDNNAEGKRMVAVQKSPGIFNCVVNDDAGLAEISPASSTIFGCHGDSLTVSFTVKNDGLNALTGFDVTLTSNSGQIINESFIQSVSSGSTHDFTFNTKMALGAGNNTVQIVIDAANDGNTFNDTITAIYPFEDSETLSVLWSEDFESFDLCATTSDCGSTVCPLENDWVNEPNGMVDESDWRTNSGDTPSDFTGPGEDHTLENSSGKYLYLEPSGGCTFQTAMLTSPCIDLTQATEPELTFWYHMEGADMGDLHVDIYDGSLWIEDIFLISGNQGNDWELAEVSLTPFVGNIVNLRFRGVTGSDYRSDISIDDIMLSHPPIANFTYGVENDGFTIDFTDYSLYADSMSFDLGEGTILDTVPASFTYANQQVYAVTQIVSNPIAMDTLLQLITTLDVENVTDQPVTLFPNPAAQYVSLNNIGAYDLLTIFDSKGALVMTLSLSSENSKTLDLSGFSNGNYLFQFDDSKAVQIVIQK
jgi:hypothetical protein